MIAQTQCEWPADTDFGQLPAKSFSLLDQQRELLVNKAAALLVELDRHPGDNALDMALRQQIMAELRSLAIPLWLDGKFDE